LKDRIARNSDRVTKDRKELNRLTRADEATIFDYAVAVYAYAEEHRDELLTPGRSSAAVDTGTIKWYQGSGGKVVFVTDEEATIDELKQLVEIGVISQEEFDEVVETKQTIKKNPLKADPELLKVLHTVHVSGGEFFSIDPANTSEKFARPVAVLRQAAIDLGFLTD
jgi:phage host-nuclease inhibitor protein Gam